MTAVQEIQDAIDVLTALKNEPIVTALFTATAADAEWFSRTSKKLAIFHRTIDAQLMTLKHSLIMAEGAGFMFSTYGCLSLALAHAISEDIA